MIKFKLINKNIGTNAIDYINNLDYSITYEVIIKEWKPDRSLSQNALLHIWCREISDAWFESRGEKIAPSQIKIQLKEVLLWEEPFVGMGGTICAATKHTSELKVKEFTKFLQDIEYYVGSEFGIRVSHPEDKYREAMAE